MVVAPCSAPSTPAQPPTPVACVIVPGPFRRAVITGGAGFVGSHLCDRLVAEGIEVLCVDNLVTGREDNVRHLLGEPSFELVHADVSERIEVEGPVDAVLHFASPASPVDYLRLPIQ